MKPLIGRLKTKRKTNFILERIPIEIDQIPRLNFTGIIFLSESL